MRNLILVVMFFCFSSEKIFSSDVCGVLYRAMGDCLSAFRMPYDSLEDSSPESTINRSDRDLGVRNPIHKGVVSDMSMSRDEVAGTKSQNPTREVYSPFHQGVGTKEQNGTPVVHKTLEVKVLPFSSGNVSSSDDEDGGSSQDDESVLDLTHEPENSLFLGLKAKQKFELVKENSENFDLFAQFTENAVLNIHALEGGEMTKLFRIYAVKGSRMVRECLGFDDEAVEHSYTRPGLLSFLNSMNFSDLDFMDEAPLEIRSKGGSVASNVGSLPKPCPYDDAKNIEFLKSLFTNIQEKDIHGYEAFKVLLEKHIYTPGIIRIVQGPDKQEILENLNAVLMTAASPFLIEMIIPRTRKAEDMSLILNVCGVSCSVESGALMCQGKTVLSDKGFVKSKKWQDRPLIARLYLLEQGDAKSLFK